MVETKTEKGEISGDNRARERGVMIPENCAPTSYTKSSTAIRHHQSEISKTRVREKESDREPEKRVQGGKQQNRATC
jgi:hypothetical protein